MAEAELIWEWIAETRCSDRSEGENYWPLWRPSTRLKIQVEWLLAKSRSDYQKYNSQERDVKYLRRLLRVQGCLRGEQRWEVGEEEKEWLVDFTANIFKTSLELNNADCLLCISGIREHFPQELFSFHSPMGLGSSPLPFEHNLRNIGCQLCNRYLFVSPQYLEDFWHMRLHVPPEPLQMILQQYGLTEQVHKLVAGPLGICASHRAGLRQRVLIESIIVEGVVVTPSLGLALLVFTHDGTPVLHALLLLEFPVQPVYVKLLTVQPVLLQLEVARRQL